MHKALYVDEIVREIFALVSEDDLGVLSVLARTCSSWTDPSLDHLWVTLPSAAPLIELIPEVSLVNQIYVPSRRLSVSDLSRFDYYGPKVRCINFRKNIEIHSDIAILLRQKSPASPCLNFLPILQHAKLCGGGLSPLTLCLARSHTLLNLEVDLGFTPGSRTPFPEDYVGAIIDAAPRLSRLLLRGTLTPPIIAKVASTRSLRTLSLRCGRSLTLEGLFNVLALPYLEELEVPLAHFDEVAFRDKLGHFRSQCPLPRLQKLVLRSQAYHTHTLLDNLPIDHLHTLSIELDGKFDTHTTWSTLFSSIRLATRLRSLSLQHFIDLDEVDNNTYTRNHEITHHDLKFLSSLHHLQQLVLDTTLPPAIDDAQLKDLLKHWPALESLDFGPGPDCLSEDESKAFEIGSSLTLQALDVITTQAPKLATLRLPIVEAGACIQGPFFTGKCQGALTQLTLAGASMLDSQTVVPYLQQMFPSLKVLDGLPQSGICS